LSLLKFAVFIMVRKWGCQITLKGDYPRTITVKSSCGTVPLN